MKHVSVRIDDDAYSFVQNLAKNKGTNEANVFREALSNFIREYSGDSNITGLDNNVRSVLREVKEISARLDSINPVIPSSPRNHELVVVDETKKKSEAKNTAYHGGASLGSLIDFLSSGGDAGRAFLEHCVKVGDAASKSNEPEEMAKYYGIALELLDLNLFREKEAEYSSALRCKLLEKLGDAKANLGQNNLALRYWAEARELYAAKGGNHNDVESQIKQAAIYRKIGLTHVMGIYNREAGLVNFRKSLEILESRKEPCIELANLYENMARLYWRTGTNLDEAEALCRKAIRLAKELSAPEIETNAYQTLGFLLPIEQKREILWYFEESLRIATETGHQEAELRVYNNLGFVYAILDSDLEKSEKFYLEGVKLAEKLGHVVLGAYVKLALCSYTYIPKGEWTKAENLASEALEELSELYPHRAVYAFQVLGQLSLRRGDFSRAEEYFSALLSFAGDAHEVQVIVPLGMGLAACALEAGEYQKAATRLEAAYETSRGIGLRFENAMRFVMCLSLLVETSLKLGRISQARAYLDELKAASKKIDEDWALALARRAEAQFELNHENLALADRLFGESREAWKRIGWRYEYARVTHIQALLKLRLADRKEALELLEESRAIFESLRAKREYDSVFSKIEAITSN